MEISQLKIDKKNGVCLYSDEKHIYWDEKDEVKYVSVTTLIHKFTQEFDEEFWSAYKALEAIMAEGFSRVKSSLLKSKKFNIKLIDKLEIDKLEFDTKRQEIKDAWEANKNKACERGTAIHLGKELNFYEGKEHEIKHFGLGGKFTCEKNYYELDLEKGVYPEYLVSRKSEDGLLRVAGQIDLLIKDGNDIYIIDYKGLPLNTPIATPMGWTLMKDIKTGDKVFDKDGNICSVLNISKIHNNPCYKITFDNNEEIVADHEHRWLISFRNTNGTFRERVMTTEEIAKHLKTKIQTSYNIPKILNAKSLSLPEQNLPIDPYLLGAWLGDGSKSCGVITNVNPDFWEEVKKRGYEVSDNLNPNGAEMRTVYGLRTELRKLNLINSKHIPDIYLRSSYKQRLDLLRGLMDTDGYFNKTRKRFVMATGQKWQAEDTAKLVSSLGWKPTIIECIKSYNGKSFDGWDTCFTATENPFLIRNQEIDFNLKTNKSNFRNIKSVELTETIETKCIEVDSQSHTFLAGYTLIPTHNTNKKLDEKSYFDPATKKHQMMKYPLNNVMDCNMLHYTLQLSTYAYLLKLINPEFNVKRLMIIHYDHDGNEKHYELKYMEKEVEIMLKFYKKQIMLDRKKELRKPIEY